MVIYNSHYLFLTKITKKNNPNYDDDHEEGLYVVASKGSKAEDADTEDDLNTWLNIHHTTLFMEKVVTDRQELLYTLGVDIDEQTTENRACFLKIWNLPQLTNDS